MKEYLYQIEDDESDESEVFIGWIRRHGKELIRCKDCKHYLAGQYCLNIDDYSKPTDFCSWAERKEE